MPASRECPFCRRTHTGEFEPELDEEIMLCRQRAAPSLRGDLEACDDIETIPVPIERELIQRTRELDQERPLTVVGP